jgi:hypothetical protein
MQGILRKNRQTSLVLPLPSPPLRDIPSEKHRCQARVEVYIELSDRIVVNNFENPKRTWHRSRRLALIMPNKDKKRAEDC